MAKEKSYRVYKYLIIILFPAVLILGNLLALMLNENFYDYLYEKSGTYSNFESVDIVKIQTKNLIGYFRGKNKLDHNFYSDQDSFHLKDVKSLMDLSSRFFILTAITSLFISVFLIFKKRYRDLSSALIAGSIFTILSIVLLGFGLLNAFDWLFFKFHLLLFSNNLWLFEESDNLIKLFPQQFFVNFANQLAINICLSSLIIVIISFVLRTKLKN